MAAWEQWKFKKKPVVGRICTCWTMLDTKLYSISDVKSLVGFTVAVDVRPAERHHEENSFFFWFVCLFEIFRAVVH